MKIKSRSPSPSHNYQSTFGRYHCHGVGDVNADGSVLLDFRAENVGDGLTDYALTGNGSLWLILGN